jgi:hypothetical protein
MLLIQTLAMKALDTQAGAAANHSGNFGVHQTQGTRIIQGSQAGAGREES